MLFRRQAEPARGGEIERAGVSRHFADHEGQIAAPQAFFQCEQRILRTGCGNMDQAVTQRRGQTRMIGPSGQTQRRLVLHPQPGTVIPGQCRIARQRQRQARAAGIAGTGEHLAVAHGRRQPRPPLGSLQQAWRCRHRTAAGKGRKGKDSGHWNRLYVLLMFLSQAIRNCFIGRLTSAQKKAACPKASGLPPLPGNRENQSIGGTGCGGASASVSCTSTSPRPTWLRLRL